MSRMGDTIRASRVKYGLSEKQLAKKTGLAESFIKDVEAGKRIPSDDQAKRMLKACGVTQSVGTEIDTANEPEVRLRPKPRPYIIPVPEDEPEPTPQQKQAQAESNDAWLDALGGVLKRVPVTDEKGLVMDHVLFPVTGGKIEGASPDKVLLFRVPDDSLSGFRIHAGDLLLTIRVKPHKRFVRDGADIHQNIEIPVTTAMLGGTINVPTLENDAKLTIPEGTPSQKTFRMKGAGIKKLNSQEKGDMYVNVTVGIPKKLTEKERELVVKLAEEMGDGGAQKTKPKKKGLFK